MAKKKKFIQLQIPFTNDQETNVGQFDPNDNGLVGLLGMPPVQLRSKANRKKVRYAFPY